jgi:hypothetical protein
MQLKNADILFDTIFSAKISQLTMAFSCGARSAFKLKEKDYLRNMLSRRQLQGSVRRR